MNPGFIQNNAASEQPVYEHKTYQAMASGGGNQATIVRGTVVVHDVAGASAAAATYTADGGRLDVLQHYIQPNGGTNGNILATNRALKVGVLLDEVAASGAVGQCRIALEGDVEARVIGHTGAAAAAVSRGTPLTALWNTNAQGTGANVGCFKVAASGDPVHAYAVSRVAGAADPLNATVVASGQAGVARVRLFGSAS